MSNATVRSWKERRPGHGLTLQVSCFAGGEPAGPRGTILILHGFLDVGSSFGDLALGLVMRGYDVMAPDLRGFGKSDWASEDGYYHFPNYVADVDALVRDIDAKPLIVVGHSMGGTVAAMFCGSRPKAASALVLIEGVGPPNMPPERALSRTRRWLDQLAIPAVARPLKDEEDALRRLTIHHPKVPTKDLKRHLKVLTRSEGGKLFWAHDPRHRTTAPVPFRVESFKAYMAAIRCPVLVVSGGPSGWHPPDEEERFAALAHPPRRMELPDAGHMMHWTAPDQLATGIANFADHSLR